MPLPALLTIQSGISKLRYATLMGIKKAKSKEVKRLSAADLGVAPRRASIAARAHLSARAHQAHAIVRRQSQGSGGETGGEIEIRGARYMSILAVMEQRGRRLEPHVVRDAGGRAAVRAGVEHHG